VADVAEVSALGAAQLGWSGLGHPANWAETHVAGPFDEEQAANARGFFLGDYEGMVTIGNVFGPFYDQAVSRAANNPSDVFYSTLTP